MGQKNIFEKMAFFDVSSEIEKFRNFCVWRKVRSKTHVAIGVKKTFS